MSASSATVEVGETFTVSCPKVDNATEYSVYVWDANGNEVKRSLEQTTLSYSTSLDVAGVYTVGVYATNGASYVYTQSECGAVNIMAIMHMRIMFWHQFLDKVPQKEASYPNEIGRNGRD